MSALDMFPEVRVDDPNRRYTTAEFMAWIKRTADVEAWDVDVAADAESHHAERWFSLLDDPGSAGMNGLQQDWGPTDEWRQRFYVPRSPDRLPWRIFCNPPFDDLEAWITKAWETAMGHDFSLCEVRIAFVLPGNRHEQPFWQRLVEPFRYGVSRKAHYGYELEVFHPPGRQSYAKPGSNGRAVGSAEWPSALLVWRRA